MTIRDQRQKEFADKWMEHRFGILDLCPRFGKIWTTINILEKYPENINILIAYPDKEIKKSWEEDFKKRNYQNPNITYTTHRSINKYIDEKYDIVIIDEIQLLSTSQIDFCKYLFMLNREVIGLTGTLSMKSEQTLSQELGLKVISYYPIEQGVEEGVVVDYQITVHQVDLDNKIRGNFKNPTRTEKTQFGALSWVINNSDGDTKFLKLARMKIVKESISKKHKTIQLLKQWKDERILVFCGLTKIADDLGIPSFHTMTKDKSIFQTFVDGKGKHLAVVKIGNSGVTYKPLQKVLINFFDSNPENMAQKIFRCMGMEYDNEDKKAHIHIVSSNEEVELNWLRKSLEFFDKEKVKYIK